MAVYSDIDMDLTKQRDGDIQKDEDVQAVFNALENIVYTIQGQRRMRPDFAYGAYNFLFEAISESNAKTLGDILNNAILLYESRIDVTNIHVMFDISKNLYSITISFIMRGRTPTVYTIPFIIKAL